MKDISLCWRCNYREQDQSTGLCSECKNLISEKLFELQSFNIITSNFINIS